jgi:hypothetical protein
MDDIERVLGSSPEPARIPGQRSGRIAFSVVAGLVVGGSGWVAGLILPFLGSVSMGFGAALGAFVTAMVAGPPRWFSS